MRPGDWDEKWRARLHEARHAETTGEPNRFLVQQAGALAPGRALDLACGAGRNAVWLAERGWRVTGVDFSPVALEAARALASERGVEVEWIEADARTWAPPPACYDLVAVLYLQLPAPERHAANAAAASAVRPGGTVVVVGHHSDNLTEGWGGPKDPAVLFTEGDVSADLRALTVERSERVPRPVVNEQGEHTAVDVLVRARRPAG